MNYKIKKAFTKNKKVLIIIVALWVLLSIVFIMPIAKSIEQAKINRNI